MSVVFFRYDGSPFCDKVDNALALKKIPHQRVNVHPIVSHRPEITHLLGVGYRRMPVLAIGNDIYCDSNIIIPVLERRFPPSKGYGTVFPPDKHGGGCNTGLLKAFTKHYGDTVLLRLVVSLLSWDKATPEMLADRSKLLGRPIAPEEFVAARPKTLAELSAHMAQIEQQLEDDREWLTDTESPSLADLSVHFSYAWIMNQSAGWFDPNVVEAVFNEHKFPKTIKWIKRVNEHLESLRADPELSTTIDAKTAAKRISEASHESEDIIGFDETVAEWLGVKCGQIIRVRPEDGGKEWPHAGKLIAISDTEMCVASQGSLGTFRVHFPRVGFSIEPVWDFWPTSGKSKQVEVNKSSL